MTFVLNMDSLPIQINTQKNLETRRKQRILRGAVANLIISLRPAAMCDQRYNPEKPLLPPLPLRFKVYGFDFGFPGGSTALIDLSARSTFSRSAPWPSSTRFAEFRLSGPRLRPRH